MRHRPLHAPRLLLAIAAALLLAGCGGATTAAPPAAPTVPANAATQTSEGGEVTVIATWDASAAQPAFTIALDTHTVDLDAIDVATLATLRVDGAAIAATGWDAPKGGHHRSGVLTFPATGAGGEPVLGPEAQRIELVIRDVAGVPERTFRWTR